MTAKALLLFTQESIDEKRADPDHLRRLLETGCKTKDLQVDNAVYDELVYDLAPGQAKMWINSTGVDLSDYDVVYLRQIKEATAQAIAVGKYCQAHGTVVIDSEIANRPGSMGKQTQYMQLALANLPFPHTLYSSSHRALLTAFDHSNFTFPLIIKSVSGSRGKDNYLIRSREELVSILKKHPSVHFLVQEYISNTGDFRVWVCGNSIGPILHRSRGAGHANNTSQGGNAALIDAGIIPKSVFENCKKAAKLFDRDVAGVDVVFENDDTKGKYYFFEVNRAPQVEGTPYQEAKAAALADYLVRVTKERKK